MLESVKIWDPSRIPCHLCARMTRKFVKHVIYMYM